jgi:hypothetical protein
MFFCPSLSLCMYIFTPQITKFRLEDIYMTRSLIIPTGHKLLLGRWSPRWCVLWNGSDKNTRGFLCEDHLEDRQRHGNVTLKVILRKEFAIMMWIIWFSIVPNERLWFRIFCCFAIGSLIESFCLLTFGGGGRYILAFIDNLYMCEASFLTLREQHRFRVFEIRA